jgi:uncharacterized membrane protein YgcG
MIMRNRRRSTPPWWTLSLLLGSVYACGSSQSGSGAGGSGPQAGSSGSGTGGASSATGGSGPSSGGSSDSNAGAPSDSSSGRGGGSSNAGSSGSNTSGTHGSTTGGTTGSSTSGSSGGASGTTTTPGPHFNGSGQGFRPLTTGCGPDTANSCTGSCEQGGGDPNVTVIRPPATLCFKGDGDATPDDPSAVIEQVIERAGDVAYVHIRITFDPSFTDNTYGDGACCGWPTRRGHNFGDLLKSDHTELQLTNTQGETVMNFKLDLISADSTADCGYGTLGVRGGDGSIILGNADDVLAVSTSTSRNLNGCGYCKNVACASSGDCTIDSPPTDENYTPDPATPNWDYRIVYEAWIALSAFGDSGFGQAFITYTHSSPSKSTDTIYVMPIPCPPEWDTPYCPPSVIQEGGNCFGSGGSGGMGGTGGTSSGTGGSGTGGTSGSSGSSGMGGTGGTGPCPPNYQTYITTEGASLCTPIPFANWDGMKPCPSGYVLDIASEGQYCVPAQ